MEKNAEISFTSDTLVFKDLKKGDSVLLHYNFRNIGNNDLKILDADADCGCTKPKFDTIIYKAGAWGKIKVTFISGNDTGEILKNIVIKSNAKKQFKVLYIKGNISSL